MTIFNSEPFQYELEILSLNPKLSSALFHNILLEGLDCIFSSPMILHIPTTSLQRCLLMLQLSFIQPDRQTLYLIYSRIFLIFQKIGILLLIIQKVSPYSLAVKDIPLTIILNLITNPYLGNILINTQECAQILNKHGISIFQKL